MNEREEKNKEGRDGGRKVSGKKIKITVFI